MSGMARDPERRPLEAKGSPPNKLSWEVPFPDTTLHRTRHRAPCEVPCVIRVCRSREQ